MNGTVAVGSYSVMVSEKIVYMSRTVIRPIVLLGAYRAYTAYGGLECAVTGSRFCKRRLIICCS